MFKAMLHALSVLDTPVDELLEEGHQVHISRVAYRDPAHDVKHLESVYNSILSEGCSYLKRSQQFADMARERFAEADRVHEQLKAAEAEMERLRA